MSIADRILPLLKRRRVWVPGILLALYAAAGFLAVPYLVRRQLPILLSAKLHRPVSLARARLNPFALSLTLDGFAVREKDGSPFLGWDRLYVNVSARTLFTLAPCFKVIQLDGLKVRVVLDRHGEPNFLDLMQPGTPEAPKTQAPPPEVRIGRLSLAGARFEFLDQATAQPFTTTLGPVSLALDGFQLQRDRRNPYTFEGRTESGETFGWQGHLWVNPMRSVGSFHFGHLALPKYAPFYRDAVAFDLRDGKVDFKADYQVSFGGGKDVLQLQHGALALRNLHLAERGSREDRVVLPSLDAQGLDLDLLAAKGRLASLTLQGGQIHVRRGPDGVVDLQRMLTSPPRPATEAKPFQFELDTLKVEGQSLDFEDRVPKPPVRLDLDQMELGLNHVSLAPDVPWDLQGDARWNRRGRIHLTGKVLPLQARGALDLKLEDLDVAPLGRYGAPALAAVLTSARLGLEGHADFDARHPAATHFKGQAQLDAFALVARTTGEPILSWKGLKATGIQVDQEPLSVKLAGLDWVGPDLRLTLDAQGGSNLAAAFQAAPAKEAPSAAPAPSALRANLGAFHLRGGRVVFLDRSIQPVATLALEALEGHVKDLSTDPQTRSDLALDARIDGAAPLQIRGQVNLLSGAAYTKVTLKAQGIDLTPLSPYAGRNVGYPIEKGKLDLDLGYLVEHRKLAGEDAIRMDQFTLGDATGSKEAVHLPVKLGLALLQDRHGLIELEVPVRGDLDQPDFKLSKVIWHAVLNVLGKIVTSPFTLLSNAFGGGADLSSMPFAPGSAVVGAAQAKVADALEKALTERPGLRLDIEGTALETADGPPLRQEALDAALLQRRGTATAPLNGLERAELVRAAYLEAFPPVPDPKKPKETPALPSPADMESRLLAKVPLDPAALRLLARQRGQAVRDRLLQGGKVEESRLFIVDSGAKAAAETSPRVIFALK